MCPSMSRYSFRLYPFSMVPSKMSQFRKRLMSDYNTLCTCSTSRFCQSPLLPGRCRGSGLGCRLISGSRFRHRCPSAPHRGCRHSGRRYFLSRPSPGWCSPPGYNGTGNRLCRLYQPLHCLSRLPCPLYLCFPPSLSKFTLPLWMEYLA